MGMKHWAIATSLLASVAPVVGAQGAPEANPSMAAQIAASGVAEATLTPDRARVFIGVQTRATTAAAAGNENARTVRAVLDTLRSLGLSPAQLRTVNYSVSPEMQYPRPDDPDKTPRVTGYVVSNTIRAEVQKIGALGNILDAALAKGANQINSLQFYSSNEDDARRAAITDAVAHARADAEAMARAAGGTLGALVELTTGEAAARPMPGAVVYSATAARAAPTPIEPGEQTVRATVSGRWLFIQSK